MIELKRHEDEKARVPLNVECSLVALYNVKFVCSVGYILTCTYPLQRLVAESSWLLDAISVGFTSCWVKEGS